MTKNTKLSPDDDNSPKENTRSKIASTYIWGFFIVIGISLIICCLDCAKGRVKEYSDLLITISGILSGPLGFIIGYYFKSGDK